MDRYRGYTLRDQDMSSFANQHELVPITAQTVFIVDDDEAARTSLSYLVESVGLTAKSYGSGTEFLAAYQPTMPGCLVLDMRLSRPRCGDSNHPA